ncbi:hypothetical protein QOZ80_9BG0702480 [Eleusine coracana subsp. coracana]|nr:hypothetical protein QOZ80_9BG0702480 [Eleusine coracana subsp. coracana]
MASIKGNIATSACQAGQVALVVRLLKRISAAAADEDNNLIFSPLLIHIVLTLMSAVAARDTLDEILNIAGVMSQEELASLVKSMTGGSIDQINAWVAKATRNLIIEVVYLDNITDDTVHVVANAIYFKGEWEDPFEKEVTADYEFHRLDGSSVKVLFL